jgi:26S proteasome regulatory subunit N2
VFYHLQEYEYSVRLALEAGPRFDIMERSQYVDTVISKCIDLYIAQRVKISEGDATVQIDQKLEDIVNKMFERCFADGEWNQAIGLSLESRRLDILERAIVGSGNIEQKLDYTYKITEDIIDSKEFRMDILNLLIKLYEQQGEGKVNYYNLTKCQFFLRAPEAAAKVLSNLLDIDSEYLKAYQIAFDLVDTENQSFLNDVNSKLSGSDHSRLNALSAILTNQVPKKLGLQFLKKNNHTDMLFLKKLMDDVGTKNSINHGACVWANGIMNAMTTNDSFLRENLNWVAKATNWNRFSATASIGMIHMGNGKEAEDILSPYINGTGPQASPYSTSGAYYAYGLINANQYSPEKVEFLKNGFRNSGNNENIQHGVALGLGLVSMASSDDDVYRELKNVLYSDSAVAGEAAALGMGLVRLGTAHEDSISEMITYANDTNHEKIIRSCALGLALIMYEKEEAADGLIEQLSQSKDAILRYGGMFTIGLAYAGTGNNSAIKKLLHFAVSDVTDDVRRAAVMNLGFLLFKTPDRLPDILDLLADSYNPHTRYGVALALGIGCAGTGMVRTLPILTKLSRDNTAYVRQGALIAMALIFIQVTENKEPKVGKIHKLYDKIIKTRHEEVLAKMGAILSTGIINAGGRNTTICLQTRSGNNKMASIIGLALFTHYWYWYPCMNFLALSLSPTSLHGLNKDLKVPKGFAFRSNAKPSLFKYPDFYKEEEVKKEKVETAVLSTTTKKQIKEKRKAETDKMDVDKPVEATKDDPVVMDEAEEKKEADKKEEDKKEEVKNEPEPCFEDKKNPSRVLRDQEKFISFLDDQRYKPLLENRHGGFIILEDSRPEETEEFYDDEEIDPEAPNPGKEDELVIPESFDFDESLQTEANLV